MLTLRYTDGVPSPYSGDRSPDDLSKYIEEHSSIYARAQLPVAPSEPQEVASSGFHRPNPDGVVVEVDEAGLEKATGEGAVLVDFYAPWCSQCVP
jgi:thiol-disulfide isomerase/thioredoxin